MKAVVMLALMLACSGSSAAPRAMDDAGAVSRGRQVGGSAEVGDAIRAVDAVVVPVVDAIPAVAPDARPVAVDAVVPDVGKLDGAGWLDDAGVLHCDPDWKAAAGGFAESCAYDLPGSGVQCLRDTRGTLPAVCRWGQAPYQAWYVRACSQCEGLAPWTVRP